MLSIIYYDRQNAALSVVVSASNVCSSTPRSIERIALLMQRQLFLQL